jgi:hypothetical protein
MVAADNLIVNAWGVLRAWTPMSKVRDCAPFHKRRAAGGSRRTIATRRRIS